MPRTHLGFELDVVTTMTAAVVSVIPTQSLDLVDVDVPVVTKPDDLLIRLEACGICGTDLHILDGHSYRPPLPFVIGHEPVGIVVDAAPSMREVWMGKRVTTTLFMGCGRCDLCRAGAERLCPDMTAMVGLLRQSGGFAEYMVFSAARAIDVPPELEPIDAAILVDAGATAFNAVTEALRSPVKAAVVVGGGPVGFLVAELLKDAGVPLMVVEPLELRRGQLEHAGHSVVSKVESVDMRPDLILDCAGEATVPPLALDLLVARGRLVVVGYTKTSIDFAVVARKELTIRGIRSGSRNDLVGALRFAAEHRIRLPEVRTWSLSNINDAFANLREGAVPGKAIIDFGWRGRRNDSAATQSK